MSLLSPGSSKKQPSPESFHVIVSTPTSMLSGQARYQRPSEKTAIQVGTCQETNQQTLSWWHTGDSRNLFIPDLMAVFFEEPGEIFFGNVDRRHAISIVNATCDNLTKGAPLHVFFAVSTVALFGTCYTLYSCHATDSQLTVNSKSTRQSTRALFLRILKQNARCVRKL